jgi:hypothetical protein
MTTTNQKIEILISALGTPNYQLQVISKEDIMNDSNLVSYNPDVASKKLNMYSKSNATFYIAKPCNIYSYSRLFVKYELDGFNMFTELSLFSSFMSNIGFKQVSITEVDDMALIHIYSFSQNKNERAENNKQNRFQFAKHNMTVTDL